MKNLKVSNYLHFQEVDKDIYIGWNRFFPSIFILNTAALDLLDRIKQNTPIKPNEKIEYFLKEFKKYKFVYEGESDPFKTDFLKTVNQHIDELDQRAKDFYRSGEDYSTLRIVNDECNLNCSYCVNNHVHSPKKFARIKKNSRDKLHLVNDCVEQFMARKIKNGVGEVSIFFNGGEILVDWMIIKNIVQRVSQKYRDIKINWEINTNLTRLSEEIANFFNRYQFKVNISIDGYREVHDKTRKYRNGKGSFDDIIKNVELYRMTNEIDSLKSFQGTIENPDRFRPEEVYKMEKYGFLSARLAPNLLNVPEEDGKKKAKIMGKFLELNTRNQFQVSELIFTKVKNKINQNEYQFSFNCRGLSGLPKLSFEINITRLSVSHLCCFIEETAVPVEQLQYDIYNPKLWQVSNKFIKSRMDSVLKNCLECPLAALCTGGCILSGLDSQNHLNKAACAYQKEIWAIYLNKAYRDRKK